MIGTLPRLFLETEKRNQHAIQEFFRSRFFALSGQKTHSRLGTPLYHYSSSVSVEVLANYLRRERKSVTLIHPTFDNIPAILKRHDIQLLPIEEFALRRPAKAIQSLTTDAIFLVLPNNPTGFQLTRAQFETLVRSCKEKGIVIILDFSFRFFSSLTKWDQYEILLSNQSDFVCIEDTGKTWPALDLKIGFITASDSLYSELEQITDDVLLNVSPFIFALLSRYISIEQQLPIKETVSQLADHNRKILRAELYDTPLKIANADSKISVEWIKLPTVWDSVDFCEWLESHQISVLPGNPFFWNQSERGRSYVRVALMRPREFFQRAASQLRRATLEYSKKHPSVRGKQLTR